MGQTDGMADPNPVIPYVDNHGGPRRRLTLVVTRVGLANKVKYATVPAASIDGRSYYVNWGEWCFEIPADRPVHVAMSLREGTQAASVVLSGGPDLVLDAVFKRSGPPSLAVR